MRKIKAEKQGNNTMLIILIQSHFRFEEHKSMKGKGCNVYKHISILNTLLSSYPKDTPAKLLILNNKRVSNIPLNKSKIQVTWHLASFGVNVLQNLIAWFVLKFIMTKTPFQIKLICSPQHLLFIKAYQVQVYVWGKNIITQLQTKTPI